MSVLKEGGENPPYYLPSQVKNLLTNLFARVRSPPACINMTFYKGFKAFRAAFINFDLDLWVKWLSSM